MQKVGTALLRHRRAQRLTSAFWSPTCYLETRASSNSNLRSHRRAKCLFRGTLCRPAGAPRRKPVASYPDSVQRLLRKCGNDLFNSDQRSVHRKYGEFGGRRAGNDTIGGEISYPWRWKRIITLYSLVRNYKTTAPGPDLPMDCPSLLCLLIPCNDWLADYIRPPEDLL